MDSNYLLIRPSKAKTTIGCFWPSSSIILKALLPYRQVDFSSVTSQIPRIFHLRPRKTYWPTSVRTSNHPLPKEVFDSVKRAKIGPKTSEKKSDQKPLGKLIILCSYKILRPCRQILVRWFLAELTDRFMVDHIHSWIGGWKKTT